MRSTTVLLLLLGVFISGLAQTPSSERQQFLRVEAPVIALAHVRVTMEPARHLATITP